MSPRLRKMPIVSVTLFFLEVDCFGRMDELRPRYFHRSLGVRSIFPRS